MTGSGQIHRSGAVGAERDALRLSVIVGPPLSIPPLSAGGGPYTLGRHSSADVRLDDPTVSRKHATLERRSGAWVIVDQGSRAGTVVNGRTLRSGEGERLMSDDVLDVGPWRLQVGGEREASTLAVRDDRETGVRLRAEPALISKPIETHRLALLLEFAGTLSEAETEQDLAERVVDAALEGSGYQHGALVRGAALSDRIEALAERGHGDAFPISRSVLQAAAGGDVVTLTEGHDLREAQSIVMHEIDDVLCVPIELSGRPYAFLYLAGSHRGVNDDEARSYCLALARLAAIALSSLRRHALERELDAAREVQRRLMPAGASLRHALHTSAGSQVAGDLFDVIELDDGRSAVLLGDVTGKGAGAGLLMSAAQAHLNAALSAGQPLAGAVRALNVFLAARSKAGEFVTLWIGLTDHATGRVEFIDAGHGYVVVAGDGGPPRRLESDGGPPLGIEPAFPYESETLESPEGARIVLFSDGLVEQRSPAGEQFGLARVVETLAPSAAPEDDVRLLVEAVRAFSKGAPLSDDLTIASVTPR